MRLQNLWEIYLISIVIDFLKYLKWTIGSGHKLGLPLGGKPLLSNVYPHQVTRLEQGLFTVLVGLALIVIICFLNCPWIYL